MERRSFLSRLLAVFSLAAPATVMASASKDKTDSDYVWLVEIYCWDIQHEAGNRWVRLSKEHRTYEEAALRADEFDKYRSSSLNWQNGYWVKDGITRVVKSRPDPALSGWNASFEELLKVGEGVHIDIPDCRRPSWSEVQNKMRRV